MAISRKGGTPYTKQKARHISAAVEDAMSDIMEILDICSGGWVPTGSLHNHLRHDGFKEWAIRQAKALLRKQKKIIYYRDDITGVWITRRV